MIFAVHYDLKAPGRKYDGLYEAIKGCGDWWHYLRSTWLVDTRLDAEAIWRRLAPYVDHGDFVLVIGVTAAYQGWLPANAWIWIRSRIAVGAG
jgi:hypothetical protein